MTISNRIGAVDKNKKTLTTNIGVHWSTFAFSGGSFKKLGIWIGLNDVRKEGTFEWDDQSMVSFTK